MTPGAYYYRYKLIDFSISPPSFSEPLLLSFSLVLQRNIRHISVFKRVFIYSPSPPPLFVRNWTSAMFSPLRKQKNRFILCPTLAAPNCVHLFMVTAADDVTSFFPQPIPSRNVASLHLPGVSTRLRAFSKEQKKKCLKGQRNVRSHSKDNTYWESGTGNLRTSTGNSRPEEFTMVGWGGGRLIIK